MSDKRSKSPLPASQSPRQSSSQEQAASYTSGDDTPSDENEWDWYPGDGICPPSSQFNAIYQASYDSWDSAATMTPPKSFDGELQLDPFLQMLHDVPEFFNDVPQHIRPVGRSFMSCSLQITTTESQFCEQRDKSVVYLQCVGFPKPTLYKEESETLPAQVSERCLRNKPGYFTIITLAWSYIISCRWVEILRDAGENCSLRHNGDAPLATCFWELVIQCRWVAELRRPEVTLFPPWMLRKSVSDLEEYNLVEVKPDSSRAFDILVQFCIDEGMQDVFLGGLVAVLMATSRNAPRLKLPPPASIPNSDGQQEGRDARMGKLYDCIDRLMTVSSTQDALDSLICSAFFDPTVPCNLVGAASLGIRKALLPNNEDYSRFLQAIVNERPHLAPLWFGVVCTGQANSMLKMALDDLPPLCPAAAFWTRTIQSFIQVPYHPLETEETRVNRALEFSTSFFSRPGPSLPWTPAPPFGTTTRDNLSIEINEHIDHNHKPLWWRSYWIGESGEMVPATPRTMVKPQAIRTIQQMQPAGSGVLMEEVESIGGKRAHVQSWAATSRLFNWHRAYDDGIWLGDGQLVDVDIVRKLQQHPWIVDPFAGDDRRAPADEKKNSELDDAAILAWAAKVQPHSE